jgi:hypothetical protein
MSQPAASKQCPDCGALRPLEEFGRNKARPDGRAYYCKPCFRRRAGEHYRKAREAAGAVVRPREAHPDGMKRCAQCREVKVLADFDKARSQSGGHNCYCKPCRRDRDRAARFLRVYGLTLEARDELIREQGGTCAICREAPPVHVDHDHVTGRVRGVVCFRCNSGIGQFSDRAELMHRAIDYLERTTWQRNRVSTGVYRLTSPRPAAAPSRSSSELQRLISSRRG